MPENSPKIAKPEQPVTQQFSESRTNVPQTPSPGKSKHAWVWWTLGVLIVLLGAWLVFRNEGQKTAKAPAPPGVPVATTIVRNGNIGNFVEALGTVTPIYTVTVTSRVQGQIVDVHYREGQMVHNGDPLLDIDPAPYQAALTQAEGQLAHDQAALAESQIDQQRYAAALERNAIAQQQYEDQKQVSAQDEGTVKNDEGAVENAKVNLAYCHIASPIDGRVGLRLVDPGNIVQANSSTALLVITQLQPITVIFSLSEDLLPQVQQQLHQGHTLAVDAYTRDDEKKIASGTLLTLDNQVDTTTGTVKLKAVFPNQDEVLFPSQFVNARLLLETLHNVALVPTAAIQRNSQGAFVYVIKPDRTASMQSVTVGITDGRANVANVKGVNPGETIAVNGFDKLQNGVKVAAQSEQTSASAGVQP